MRLASNSFQVIWTKNTERREALPGLDDRTIIQIISGVVGFPATSCRLMNPWFSRMNIQVVRIYYLLGVLGTWNLKPNVSSGNPQFFRQAIMEGLSESRIPISLALFEDWILQDTIKYLGGITILLKRICTVNILLKDQWQNGWLLWLSEDFLKANLSAPIWSIGIFFFAMCSNLYSPTFDSGFTAKDIYQYILSAANSNELRWWLEAQQGQYYS